MYSELTPASSVNAGGFVGEHEAGQRLFQAAHDPRCSKSGVYWSWNGGPREGRGAAALEKGGQISGGGGAGGGWDSIFENDQSSKVLNLETAMDLFKYSIEITGAEWPDVRQVTSPCPTLKVIGAVTKGMVQREELKRMREMGRPGMDETPVKVTRVKKVAAATDRVVGGVLSNTIGRVGRFVGRRLLGDFPDTAVEGSFQEEAVEPVGVVSEDREAIEDAISQQLEVDREENVVVDGEDEALFQQIYDDAATNDEKSPISA